MHNWNEFCQTFKYNWDIIDYPKEKIEWIIVDSSKKDHSDLIPFEENIYYIHIDPIKYLDKINFKNDNDKVLWNYFNKSGRLPNGFMRDYAVGLTSNDYILHIDYDTLYRPKTIRRKLNFLKNNHLECVYCREMLAYNIYNHQFYKIEDKSNGYESTLFHTRGFWEKGGFKWEDIQNEAFSFYYGKGLERSMDNYYDSIKIISIHNINQYNPIKLDIGQLNISIKIPDLIKNLNIKKHPMTETLYDIFNNQNINVIGIESEIIDQIKKENWNCKNITENKKVKEKTLIKKIKNLEQKNNLCIINTKYPIWSIFKEIHFDIVILESNKNFDQMNSILKENNFISFENLYLNRNFLIS
ncbi:MAG: hypothetical protein CMH79_04280 [Nitrospinae bacterium]|nr:hypothetical protein [Nitrospinota bacterium]